MARDISSGVVAVDRLYRPAGLDGLAFATTDDLEPLDGFLGQTRAIDALHLGASVDGAGFNIFAVGRIDSQMRRAVETVLKATPPRRPVPDWAYVYNFADPRRPRAVSLEAGQAPVFAGAMHTLILDLQAALRSAFESEDYQAQRGGIDETINKQQNEAFAALQQRAAEKNIIVLRTPMGFTLAPTEDGKIVAPEVFGSWTEARRTQVQDDVAALEKDLEKIVRQAPQREKARREAVRELDRRSAEAAVGHLIAEVRQQFPANAAIADHLDRVREDLIDNVAVLVSGGETAPGEAMSGSPFDRYEVNVVVSQPAGDGAPIIEETHPTLGALTGAIEHISLQGALITNFRLIKAGAIHRANGGYLILDARELLSEPFSWQALKRALRRREIVIEDVSRLVGFANTVTLEPDPISLDLKVVLFGDRFLHMALSAADADLAEHFKVLADFDDDVERSPESEAVMARLTAAIVRAESLRPLDKAAVARVVEHAARLADDQARLTLWIDQIRDLLVEADHLSGQVGRAVTGREAIQAAIDARAERSGRVRDRMQAMTLQDVMMVDTESARVGLINGLSVTGLPGASFGRPSRITCRVRPGAGRLIDIEREVELGGPLHSKGVLILSGFLSGRYVLTEMMSLQASLVFEQSYGGVDGDSASSAELYCLLSALAEVPLRQDLAVTGSVNQLGEVKAIGGVNEKIEGFFDLCAARGLTGTQGVVIPAANIQHLMLRADVVEACAAGRFAIHAVSTIDEGATLLTGMPAGERGADGVYPDGSLNRRVEDRLKAFSHARAAVEPKPAESAPP